MKRKGPIFQTPHQSGPSLDAHWLMGFDWQTPVVRQVNLAPERVAWLNASEFLGRVWWRTPLKPALRKRMQADFCEFKTRLLYRVSSQDSQHYIENLKNKKGSTNLTSPHSDLELCPVVLHSFRILDSACFLA